MNGLKVKNKLLKMGQLVRLTGVNSATIKYYIKEGLLGKPVKPNKNMAYYDESYIDKIKIIKELQKKRFLPLKVIKKIFSNISSLEELRNSLMLDIKIFKTLIFPEGTRSLTEYDLIKRTGILQKDINGLKKAKIIEPRNGLYDEDDILVAGIMASFRKKGFTERRGFGVEDLRFLKYYIEKIAREEIVLFTNKFGDRMFTMEASKIAREGVENINVLFSVLNRRAIKKLINELIGETLKEE